jgi:1,4-alpha-glucan branching enzyme
MKLTRKSKSAGLKSQPVAEQPLTQRAVKGAPAPATVAKVALKLVKPGAKAVHVAGSFNDWKPERTPLVQTSSGDWAGEVRLQPGRHEYLFVVDGQWVPDPNAKEAVQNPFGGYNSVLRVSA